EAAQSLAGGDVKPRNVSYVYGDADKERVTALMAGTTTFASYTYDAAGNQLQRAYPGSSDTWDYTYDGEDQLRRALQHHAGSITGSEEYWYAVGKRFATVKRDASGAATELIWFLGDTEAHYDPTGTLTHVVSYPALGTPLARVDRTSNTTTTLELDFHG